MNCGKPRYLKLNLKNLTSLFPTSCQKCSSCQNAVEPEAQRVSYGDYHWHAEPQCFKCSGCSKCLIGQRFMAVKNFLFCSVECKKKIMA